jgi:hypothetical protein
MSGTAAADVDDPGPMTSDFDDGGSVPDPSGGIADTFSTGSFDTPAAPVESFDAPVDPLPVAMNPTPTPDPLATSRLRFRSLAVTRSGRIRSL